MGGDYSFWIIVSDVELPFADSTVSTCLGTNGIGVRHRSCWMNNGCEGEMSLLGLDASCIVGLFKPAEIGWLCDTSCVGRFVDVTAGRRWSSTSACQKVAMQTAISYLF